MTSPNALPPKSGTPAPDRIAMVVLVSLTFLAMGRLCGHDFTWWDDQQTVHQNGWLQPPTFRTLVHYATTPAFGLYIPLTYMVWAALAVSAHVQKDEYGIALNPWQFHTANVVCHLLAVLMVYRILRLLKTDPFAATCGALLFGVHPIQVEAVAWVSGLKDVLSGLLALVALWQYTLFSQAGVQRRRSWTFYTASVIAFLLALLAKPSVMAVPLAALAIDRWGVGRSWRKTLPGAIGLLLIAIPFAFIARRVQDASTTPMPDIWMRPLIVSDSLAFYIGKILWPLRLAVDYGRNPTEVLLHGWCYWDWVVPGSLVIAVATGAKNRPILLAAGMIFLAGCAPVLGFTPALFQLYSTTADHYLYLSMLGPALALAWVLSSLSSIPLRLITCGVLGVLISMTIHQGGYWKNDVTLFSHEIEVNPLSYVGYFGLGDAYGRQQDLPRAVDAFQRAVRSTPQYPLAWSALADALRESGRPEEAIESARRSLAIQIEYSYFQPCLLHDNQLIGELLFSRGRFAESIPYLEKACSLDSGNRRLQHDLNEATRIAAASTLPSTTQATLSTNP